MPRRLNLNRREFVRAAALTAGGALLGGGGLAAALADAPVRVRPNVSDLDPAGPEIAALRAGVKAMKDLPASSPKNWTATAQIHNQFCPHANWFFLPWHRTYIHYFEQLCRELSGSPDFMLPYWDWTTARKIPAPFWGADNPLMNDTRLVGPDDEAAEENVGERVIRRVFNETVFHLFANAGSKTQRGRARRGMLEATAHNYIHNTFIGGDMGGLMSPLDPIFWLHHANVDRLWVEWTQRHPGRTTADPDWLDLEFEGFIDLNGDAVKVRVADTLSTERFGYRYPGQQPAPLAPGPVLPAPQVLSRTSVEVGKRSLASAPASATISAPDRLRKRLASVAATGEALQRDGAPRTSDEAEKALPRLGTTLILSVEVETPADLNIGVRVFLNARDASTSTPLDDPSYVATFNFFADHAGHAAGAADTQTFSFNVTRTVQQLALAGRYEPGTQPRVTLVPFAYRPGPRAEPAVVVRSLLLEDVG